MPDIFVSDTKKHHRPHAAPSHGPPRDESKEGPIVPIRKKDEDDSDIRHPNPMFPLAAYAVDPVGVSFATQGESEEIHLFMRQHVITNIPWIVFSVILVLLPPLFSPFIGSVFPLASALPGQAIFVLVLFYYIIVSGFIITSFINWYFNVYIVTNERVVDVDFVNIIYKEVSATRLNLIQDVTTKTGGVIGAFFDFGDVFVQTAGAETNFDFHRVPHPQEVGRQIEQLMEDARKGQGVSDIEKAIER